MPINVNFVVVIIAVIGVIVVPSHAVESHAELCWKVKLGNTPMPRVLKDSLPIGPIVESVKWSPDNRLNPSSLFDPKPSKYALSSSDLDAKTRNYALSSADLDAKTRNYAISSADLDAKTRNYALSSADLDAKTRNYALSSADLDAKTRNYALSSADLDAKTRNYALKSADLDAKTRNYALSSADYALNSAELDAKTRNYALSSSYLDTASINYKIKSDKSNPDSKPQLPQDGRVLYFTDELLMVGEKMKLLFSKNDNEAKFLPLQFANSLPFSSKKLQVVLNLLSVNPKSIAAQHIAKTIIECETKGVKNEIKYCAATLEGMIDYVTQINSGKNKFKVLSTEQDNENLIEYKIQEVHKVGNDENNVVCHKMNNPYAVFLCHNVKNTNAYVVNLIGVNNGKEIKAIAVCHKDTSDWNPEHIAFQVLKIKPGSKPVCHFLGTNALAWVPI